MADLPEERSSDAAPFTYVGMDMFGPFVTKEGRKELKCYGATFTCLASRAIHLEVVNSMDRLLHHVFKVYWMPWKSQNAKV